MTFHCIVQEKSAWRSWKYTELDKSTQVAGFVHEYDGLTYITVKVRKFDENLLGQVLHLVFVKKEILDKMHLTRLSGVPNLLHTLFLLNTLTKQNVKSKVQDNDNNLEEMEKNSLPNFAFLM